MSFDVAPGQTLGVVGASGSGKTTLARLLVGLDQPRRGNVLIHGAPPRPGRSAAQLVFQDTAGSLDRRQSVAEALLEATGPPRSSRASARATVNALLHQVGLSTDLARQRPRQLSGGQRQRICIARALATRPQLLVLDEPVSALDVLVQAEIIELLDRLRRTGTTLVVISHDLAVVEQLADQLLVIHDGRVVEHGGTEQVLRRPTHPVTRELIAARPSPQHTEQRLRIRPSTTLSRQPAGLTSRRDAHPLPADVRRP